MPDMHFGITNGITNAGSADKLELSGQRAWLVFW
jgi:hypothetical protein